MTQPDQLYRYLFEHHQVRGELVQLEQTCASMLQAQSYPLAVRQILAEMLVATSLLTATLKFEGSITVQLQGQGPLRLAVINGDHQQQLRGVARWEGDLDQPLSFRELIGDGHMVITITPDQGERYQGIIALEQDSLAACLEQYFAQSEQLATRIWIRTQTSDEASAAAGMLLQALPAQDDNHEADFEHLATLTDTIKDEYHDDGNPDFQGGAPTATAVPERDRKQETVRRTDAKVGRNDPCPCGSGKKYKKCCGNQ